MADQKITQLTSLTASEVSDSDVVAIVDVSPTATTKKMTRTEFFKNTPNIGIGTTDTPSHPLHVASSGTGASDIFRISSGGGGSFLIRCEDRAAADPTWTVRTFSNEPIVFKIATTEVMRLSANGNVGIGTTTPSEKLDVSGNVTISGSLSKGSGSFRIDHPLKPDTHHLVHSFIEGPQADNIYRGKAALVDGAATVNLDEAARMTEGTFVALNGNIQCFTTNETGWTAVRGTVSGNILAIEAQDQACTDTVSWLVIGERHDQHMLDTAWTDEQGRIIVEPEKVIVEEVPE